MKLLFATNDRGEPVSPGAVADAAPELREPGKTPELQLYLPELSREHIQNSAAQAMLAENHFSIAVREMGELYRHSAIRLVKDYRARKKFVREGLDRAKQEFETLKQRGAGQSSAEQTDAPGSNSQLGATAPEAESSGSDKSASFGMSRSATETPRPPEPSRRELDRRKELGEVEHEIAALRDLKEHLSGRGHSQSKCAAMRVFGSAALLSSVVALAILFDSYTRAYPLFARVLAGVRWAFFGARTAPATLSGFLELALFFGLPMAAAGWVLSLARGKQESLRNAFLGFLLGFAIALPAAFADGETASRLILDFSLALGAVAVGSSLVYLILTRSASQTTGEEHAQWWSRWDRTLFPLAALIPFAVVWMSLAAVAGSPSMMLPAVLLACIQMAGSWALARAQKFRDLEQDIRRFESRKAS